MEFNHHDPMKNVSLHRLRDLRFKQCHDLNIKSEIVCE